MILNNILLELIYGADDWQPIDPLPFFKEGVQGAFMSESGPY